MKHLFLHPLLESNIKRSFEDYLDADGDPIESAWDFMCETLKKHLNGNRVKKQRWDIFESTFEGSFVPDKLKMVGLVYRVLYFPTKEAYENCLANGIDTTRSYVISTTKSLDCIPYIQDQMAFNNPYYAVFSLDSTNASCFFDVEKMSEYSGADDRHWQEQEVLIRTSIVPRLDSSRIIDHGAF